ncbi:MAG: hypothetical protein JO290_07905 [Sphingomonadaceae bacterium]|nr:hypothetical protein [Sphingomonadaceae bacterium]
MKMLLAVVLAAGATAAQAQGPCGDDRLMTIRVSKLTAAGTPAGFLDAVKDHKAWYAAHGFKDDQFVTAPALAPDKGGLKPSASEYVTFHLYGDAAPKHDAAWDAYVAKYRANSTIESEVRVCLPKGATIGR